MVTGDGPPLLGRNWLKSMQLNWKKIAAVTLQQDPKKLDTLLKEHHEIFSDNLGTIQQFKAQLAIKENAKPKFFKPTVRADRHKASSRRQARSFRTDGSS